MIDMKNEIEKTRFSEAVRKQKAQKSNILVSIFYIYNYFYIL